MRPTILCKCFPLISFKFWKCYAMNSSQMNARDPSRAFAFCPEERTPIMRAPATLQALSAVLARIFRPQSAPSESRPKEVRNSVHFQYASHSMHRTSSFFYCRVYRQRFQRLFTSFVPTGYCSKSDSNLVQVESIYARIQMTSSFFIFPVFNALTGFLSHATSVETRRPQNDSQP